MISFVCKTALVGLLLFFQRGFSVEMTSDGYEPPVFAAPLMQNYGVATTSSHLRRLAATEEKSVNNTNLLPLFQGMGVHYVYMWVGSPPQRVTVIVDTGSHHTAFPCVGCKCGKHVCFIFHSFFVLRRRFYLLLLPFSPHCRLSRISYCRWTHSGIHRSLALPI
jgi:hypothetical protein